ncbi:histidine kinase [Paracidovorax avenae]|nr:histidine kinase [Paracidovorax avenae]AVS94484.1 histidine kinase [Paracidovorax avenae]AVT18301.1 histidine kinase [Paracidovorax avenae]AVT22389.1 histidine kinase [Paracidovorax avenae]
MHEFLAANRGALIARCRDKVALRSPGMVKEELAHGVTVFLDQLIQTLMAEHTDDPQRSRQVSGIAGGVSATSEIGDTATRHGRELMGHGFTVEEVVHDYGDLCQAISDMAFAAGVDIGVGEFRTLNRCLDNAIASAVTEYTHQREIEADDRHTQALNERLGVFAHELRNMLFAAKLAQQAIKAGDVGANGATAGVLDRALASMGKLIDRSLAEVRITAGMPAQRQRFSLAEFIAEIRLSATMEAQSRACLFNVPTVDTALALEADRDLMLAAVGNLLQNAFKFSRTDGGVVSLYAGAAGERILIDVQDNGPGLSDTAIQALFRPFTQSGDDRSGMGLGLTISRRSVELNGGTLDVRRAPDGGCVFTIAMPGHTLP